MKPIHDVKFRPCAGFYVYFAALLFTALFTQALRSHISAILYIFLIILPFCSLPLLFAASAAVTVYLDTPQQTVGRETPVTTRLKLVNSSPFPLPYMECDLSLPGSEAEYRRLSFSLAPAGAYSITERLFFKYRGEYQIGISSLYVSDIFRLFRLRIDIGSYTCVYVTPRRLSMSNTISSTRSDYASESSPRIPDPERSETADLRAYIEGDSPRDIQWKLSARYDELTVREYSTGSVGSLYIVCDLSGVGEDKALNGYDSEADDFVINGVVEAALSLCFDRTERGGSAYMLWRDQSFESDCAIKYAESRESCDEIFTMLTAAKQTSDGQTLSALSQRLQALSHCAIVIISGRTDVEITSLLSLSCAGEDNAVSLCYIDSSAHIVGDENKARFREYISASRIRLASGGVTMFEPEFNETLLTR